MSRRRPIPRLRGDDRGVAAIEFGLILIPLLILLLGIIDLGYMMYMRSVFQGALNDVARQATVENPDFTTAGATIDAKIDNAIKAKMAPIASRATYEIRKSSYYQFSSVGKPEKLVTDKNSNGRYDTGDCWQDDNGNATYDTDGGKTGLGGADDIVNYHATLTLKRVLPTPKLFGLAPNYVINVRTTVRNQPFKNQPTPAVACS